MSPHIAQCQIQAMAQNAWHVCLRFPLEFLHVADIFI